MFCRGSCFINDICNYLHIPVFNTISVSWYSCGPTVTRRMPLVEQSLVTLPKHSSSPSVFIEVHVAQRLFFCVNLCKLLFVFFVLAIMPSVWLRFVASDYHFLYLETLITDKVFLFSHGHYIILLNITSEMILLFSTFLYLLFLKWFYQNIVSIYTNYIWYRAEDTFWCDIVQIKKKLCGKI